MVRQGREGWRRAWPWVLAYWLAQPVAIGLALALWGALMPDEDWMYGLTNLEEIPYILLEPGYWGYVLFLAGVVTAAQAVFLWPVRRPRTTPGRGRGLRTSLGVAGLMVGLGGGALALGALSLFDREMNRTGELIGAMPPFKQVCLVVFLLLTLWALPSVLLARFCTLGRKETVLGRLAQRILAGTAAEAALLIPIDAMVRRKTDCHCAEGSFIGLTLLGAVGFVGLGPLVLLPLFAKRRRGWYRTHCGACGYDMTGGTGQERCPECGAPWSGLGGEAPRPVE